MGNQKSSLFELMVPWIFNIASQPFDPLIQKEWVEKHACSYKCIESLIIELQFINYKKSKWNEKHRYAFIGGGYTIDLKEMV